MMGDAMEKSMSRFKLLGAMTIFSMLTAAQPPAYGAEGREIIAPPWSFACMSDQGPRECGEPMWIYGADRQDAGQRHVNSRVHGSSIELRFPVPK